ncbi:MAG: chitobiase/beta-hexosaminidase C-terminal domain-containing protein [Patescibacteria group bacterium]
MKLRLFTTLVLALALAAPVYSSTFEGTLTTGVQTGVEGTVIVAPSASPSAGVYTSAQSVVLTALGASSIHYTTDGTAPTCTSGSTYGAAINVSTSQVIQARSCYPSGVVSAVSVFAYAINPPSAPAPSGGGGGGGGGGGATPTPTPSVSPTPTPSPTPIVAGATAKTADINKDGKVDVLDFNVLLVNWGTPSNNDADLNGDGKVDIIDFNALIVAWS